MTLRLFSIAVAIIAVALVFELMRRRKLREKYSVIWLVIGLVAVLLAIAPVILTGVADLLGVAVPANLLFFGSLIVSFFVALQLSIEVGHLEEETRSLAEEVAMLRLQVTELESKSKRGEPGSRDQ